MVVREGGVLQLVVGCGILEELEQLKLTGQGEQEADPDCTAKLLAGQAWQVSSEYALAALLKVPGGHGLGKILQSGQ